MIDRKELAPLLALMVVFGSLVAVAAVNVASDSGDSFTIIHTNDTHCFYDGDGGVGFPTVSALKEQYSRKGVVFTVDAGDFLQGNSYGTMTAGQGSVDVMNTIGYDLCVPGNHEFDFGLDVLLERVGQLDFPIICANLVYSDTGENVFDGYIVLEKRGIRVGFFGLLTPETPTVTTEGAMGNTEVTDPVTAAEEMVSVLRAQNVDAVVAVGHLGVAREGFITSDELCRDVPGIDIFIDGHSHTEMEDGKVCDGSIVLEESDTMIASTGCYLHNVGIITCKSGSIDAKLYRGPALSSHPVSMAIQEVKDYVDSLLSTVIGSTEILLVGERDIIRNGETNLGDLAADAVRSALDTDVAIVNAGGLRTSIQAGDIRLKDVYDVMPFLNYSCKVEVPGSVLWEEMEFSLALMGNSKGGFIQFSGMTVTYDPSAEAGHKVLSITVAGEEVDKTATYSVATSDFVAGGGDGNVYFKGYEKKFGADMDSIFADYIENIGTITESTVEGGRLVAA